MTFSTAAVSLPCFQALSAKLRGWSGESPSAMWQDWQCSRYRASVAAGFASAAASTINDAARAWIIPERYTRASTARQGRV